MLGLAPSSSCCRQHGMAPPEKQRVVDVGGRKLHAAIVFRLSRIRVLSSIRAVVLAGRFLDRKELDALLAEAKNAASKQ